MKKCISVIAILTLVSSLTFGQDVFFVDPNFKNILVSNPAINTNLDTEIQQTEAVAYAGTLSVNNSAISDLTGIEAFTNITQLVCFGNQLSSLDLSQNSALTTVDCSNNQLTSFITNNPVLSTIYCSYNKLTYLDVSQDPALYALYCNDNLLTSITLNNPLLDYLNCYNNKLQSIVTTGCSALTGLDCSSNLLTFLDVSPSPNLAYLYVSYNQLSSLNLSNNVALRGIDCGHNQILNLNLSNNPLLEELICDYNQIHYLELSNNHNLSGLVCNNNLLSSLNIQNGNNINLGSNDVSFDARNNTGLSCIMVDDTALMNSAWGPKIDASSYFSTSCSPCTVYIPDSIFKAQLVANTAINTNANSEIECSEAEVFSGFIFVNSLNIADVTGIEAFPQIANFSCNNNQITKLNLGGNTSLHYANCSFNQITNLKLPAGLSFQELSCNNNQLRKLDIESCTNLNFLDCSENFISSLDLYSSSELAYFYCNNNSIDALDLSNNHFLVQFGSNFNSLNYLNLKNGNNANMSYFSAYGNPNLSCIQVDDTAFANANWSGNIDTTASFNITCAACVVNIPDTNFKAILLANTNLNTNANNEIECTEAAAYTGSIDIGNGVGPNITDLTGLEKFTGITYLDCSYNDLTTLDVSANTALITLYATDNQLTSIDISSNTALENLNLASNQLSNVNTSNNPNLHFLHLADNQLSSIDLSQNYYLTELILRNNQLASIDLSTNYSLQGLSLYNNKLTSLDVSNNYSLTWYLYCEHNQLYSLDLRNGVNSFLANFSAYNNPLLTCVLVDDTAWANANWTPFVDPTASFEIVCPSCVVSIPDANFKTALVTDPFINLNGNAEIECSEALAFNGVLNVNGLGISDLTGIGSFLNISGLFCNNNLLTSLDVSNNLYLTVLRCSNNSINSLILPASDSLKIILCAFNQISNLDVSFNYGLTNLICNDNLLSSLYLSQNNKLQELWCFNNQLSSLDLGTNPEISSVRCYNNQLTSLNVYGASNLFNLECYNNTLSFLDLNTCTSLNTLDCSNNQISTLFFTGSIVSFYCQNNLLSNLDLSGNSGLLSINCSSNSLQSLNIQNGNNSSLSPFDATNNPSLLCIQVDDTTFMNATWSLGKDAIAYFSVDCNCLLPAAPGIITGSTFAASCVNQLGFEYRIDTIARATGYIWYLPPAAAIVGNADTNVVIVDYDAYSSSGFVSVAGTNSCGTGPASTLPITFKPIPVVEICRTTIDSASQKTMLEWQKPIESYVNGYAIYRDSSGVYKKLDIVSNSLFSSYLDTGSHPNLHAEKYKIAVYDSCGNIGDISAPFSHQTMNLYGSIQPGGITKLYWNDYVGINDPLRYMNLLRDNTGSGPFTDTLAKNINPQPFMNFTDVSSAAYPLCRYVVQMVYESNCTPSQRTMLTKNTTQSNIKNKIALFDSTTVGLQNVNGASSVFTIFPNPAKDKITIIQTSPSNYLQLTICDLLGQVVCAQKLFPEKRKEQFEFSLPNLKGGTYFIRLENENHNQITQKLIVN